MAWHRLYLIPHHLAMQGGTWTEFETTLSAVQGRGSEQSSHQDQFSAILMDPGFDLVQTIVISKWE
jgi:hypothetical protein